jgi:hypothetical protein
MILTRQGEDTMATKRVTACLITTLALLILLGGAASADKPPGGGGPPCVDADCGERFGRIPRVDVQLHFTYRAIPDCGQGPHDHEVGMVVTIANGGKLHLEESAGQGLVYHDQMLIFLRGSYAAGAINFNAKEPDGTAKFGSCYLAPAPECMVKVDLNLLTSSPSSGPPGVTDYDLADGSYVVEAIYADGSRARMLFRGGSGP